MARFNDGSTRTTAVRRSRVAPHSGDPVDGRRHALEHLPGMWIRNLCRFYVEVSLDNFPQIDWSLGIVSPLSAMITLKVDSRMPHAAVIAVGGSVSTVA